MTRTGSLLVGLTGGIGTGKSRVAERLRELGVVVECADRIVREVQAPGSEALRRIAEEFGPEYLTPSGELDRARLGKFVFDHPERLAALNRIVHPLVMAEMNARIARHREHGVPVIVIDVPLLFEGRAAGRATVAGLAFDEVVLVYAKPQQQLERVMARDGLSREDALARIRSQMPIDEKRALADVVIDNSGSWEDTERAVDALQARWGSDEKPQVSRTPPPAAVEPRPPGPPQASSGGTRDTEPTS